MAISHTAKIFLSIQAQDFIEDNDTCKAADFIGVIPEHSSSELH